MGTSFFVMKEKLVYLLLGSFVTSHFNFLKIFLSWEDKITLECTWLPESLDNCCNTWNASLLTAALEDKAISISSV